MSHQASIAIRKKDGSINSIYCHADGYLFECGANLYRYYLSPKRVNELINDGDVRYLGKTLFDMKNPKNTRRVNGENSKPISFNSIEEYMDFFFYGLKVTHTRCIESYLFDEETNEWLVGSKYADKFISYTEALNGEIFKTNDTKEYIERLKSTRDNNTHLIDYSNEEYMKKYFNTIISSLEQAVIEYHDGENTAEKNFTCIEEMIEILKNHRNILNGQDKTVELSDKPKVLHI